MTDADLKNDIVTLYNQNFTEDELLEMIAFYDTPTGQKALAQMPIIMGQAMQLGQKHSQKYVPAFQKKIEAIVAEHMGAGEGGQEAPAPKPE